MDGNQVQRAVELDLPAVPATCSDARHAVRTALAEVPVDLEGVLLALTEAVTNVVVHAYRHRDPADEPGRVRVGLAIEPGAAVVVVADDGMGMAPRTDSPGLGMGLSIIASSCDALDIEQRQDGTRIHMRFVVHADDSDAEAEVSTGG